MKKLKMNYVVLICLIFMSVNACKEANIDQANSKNFEVEKERITSVLMNQQEAWNAFEIDAFMDGYWKSEELTFIGSRGITKGWQQTLDNYKKSYPDPAAMGKLDFEIIQLDVISDENAIMIGRYTLFREKDTPSGLFTLRWKKFEGKWKIVSDQTCG